MKKIITLCILLLTAGLLAAQEIETGFGGRIDYAPGAVSATAGLDTVLWSPSAGAFQAGIRISAGAGFGEEVNISLLGRYKAEFGIYQPVISLGPTIVFNSRFRYLHSYPTAELSGNNALFFEAEIEPLRFKAALPAVDTSFSALALRFGTSLTEPFERWSGNIDLIKIGFSLKEDE